MSNTHEANVVRVGPILPHPNADKLEITMVGGYQVVIGKGNFKEGDLAVYVQPDSVVPQTKPFEFIWGQYQTFIPGTTTVDTSIEVPAKRRRITVKRLRKEYSEGLLMPLADFPELDPTEVIVNEGVNVAETLDITHWVPEFDAESTSADSQAMPKRKYPKTAKGWFYFLLRKLGLRNAGGKSYALEVTFDTPYYDINALKNAQRNRFADCGEQVTITEKIHGSNARYLVKDDVFYAGSHGQWKQDGPNVWWNAARQFPQIEAWCRENPGKVLYGEVGPTQKGFRYGAGEGETFFFAFDVYDTENDNWDWPGNFGFTPTVPILYVGEYTPEVVNQYVDGKSVVPSAQHIREGIVISSRERRLKLKVVSNAYLEGDSK